MAGLLYDLPRRHARYPNKRADSQARRRAIILDFPMAQRGTLGKKKICNQERENLRKRQQSLRPLLGTRWRKFVDGLPTSRCLFYPTESVGRWLSRVMCPVDRDRYEMIC
jgi:hypothetical protein